MQKAVLKLTKLIIDKADTRANKFYFTLKYLENNKEENQIRGVYDFSESIDDFAEKVIRDIKRNTQKKISNYIDDEDDPLGSYVNVLMDEKDEGLQQDKLAREIKRLKEKVKNFKSSSMSTEYIKKYQELSTLQADL